MYRLSTTRWWVVESTVLFRLLKECIEYVTVGIHKGPIFNDFVDIVPYSS